MNAPDKSPLRFFDADAMASIFGIYADKRNRKHIFPKGTEKSIEGYFGGGLFTFICVLFGGLFSNALGLSVWTIDTMLILGLILSILFVLIDIITTKIRLQDNYLYPLIMGFTTILILIALNIPIF